MPLSHLKIISKLKKKFKFLNYKLRIKPLLVFSPTNEINTEYLLVTTPTMEKNYELKCRIGCHSELAVRNLNFRNKRDFSHETRNEKKH